MSECSLGRALCLPTLQSLAAHSPSPCFLPISAGNKGPTYSDWPNDAKTLANIETRYRLDSTINLGLLLGPKTNIIDIEVDGLEGETSLRKLFDGEPAETLEFQSRKGKHRLYQYDARLEHLPASLRGRALAEYPDIEIRIGATAGAQTAIPPSVTNGFEREWLNDLPIAKLPDAVIERIAVCEAKQSAPSIATGWEVIDRIQDELQQAKLASVRDWLARNHVRHSAPERQATGNYKITLDRCPHRPSETDGGAVIYINREGVYYRCEHRKCDGRTLADLIASWGPIEPRDDGDCFPVITSADLDAGDYEVEYLIKEMLVSAMPGIIGGVSKTLKTSICIDASVSLATGTKFLGMFEVTRKCRVLIMSGESGAGALQDTARRICKARGLRLGEIDNLIWSEHLPELDKDSDLERLARTLRKHRAEVLFIDPAYLCFGGDNHGDVFEQGKLLRRISKVCVDAGTTLLVVHHNRKSAAKSKDPPQLEDLAMAGFSEFARQWLLLGRRDSFRPGAPHALWLNAGGSNGHSGLYELDVDEGVRPDRIWDVSIADHFTAKREADATQLAAEKRAVAEHLEKHKKGASATAIYEATQIPKDRLKLVLEAMVNDGSIVKGPVPHPQSKTKMLPHPGYRLAA